MIYRVGFDNEIVAPLGIDDARIWVSSSGSRRLDARVIGGTTGRTVLVTNEPDAIVPHAVEAGAELTADVTDEHGGR